MARRILSLIGIYLWLTGVLALVPTSVNGQATNGVISGTVTDPSGAALPGATVQVKNVSTGVRSRCPSFLRWTPIAIV
jgi:hypothetical protein